jgi:hypothetical protein
MSLGGDRFIEAPRTGLRVRISSLRDPYHADQFTGARRFDQPARAVDAHPQGDARAPGGRDRARLALNAR